MNGVYLFLMIIGAVAYFCLAVKIADMVGDATEKTGFGFGFCAVTWASIMALPICIFFGVST